ncbi:MAG: hypothetical protein E7F23_10350 [Bifidobacterium breve]|nr:hypothetical protein [Bifidobacterium breve]
MGNISTRIEEGDGFKVLRYGLGSIVLIIGYPQSENDLIAARNAIAKQFDYEISMNGRRHGGHRSVRAAVVPESVVDLNQRPPQGGTRIEIDKRPLGDTEGPTSNRDHATRRGGAPQFIESLRRILFSR